MRIESEKPCKGGGWLHPKDENSIHLPLPPRPPRISDEEMQKKWEPLARKFHQAGIDRLVELAVELGVSKAALVSLEVGYAADLQGRACWTFPERNHCGMVVGISRRLADGKGKLFCKGSRRGLSYRCDWATNVLPKSPIYLVEGGSDTAAGITLGLPVIGRPSNAGGIALLAKLLRGFSAYQIVVVGERDKKTKAYLEKMEPPHDPQCRCCRRCFPGKSGAIDTAKALAKELGRRVSFALPPAPAKDLRMWLNRSGIDPENKEACLELGRAWIRLTR